MRLRNIPRAEGVLEAAKKLLRIHRTYTEAGIRSLEMTSHCTLRSEWERDSSY